ncbi:MAG TPA: hypothetical protein VGG25_21720 [Streptosporangiaceae bacterium]|jgi:beta-phosphoglucomutase-like phosphatase (HAD superfamily)
MPTISLVLASSGQQRHVDIFLDKLGARGIADDWTSSADVETSKPTPDLCRWRWRSWAGRQANRA